MGKITTLICATLAVALLTDSATGQSDLSPQPLLVVADQAVFSSDFSKPMKKLDKTTFRRRQGTQWEIADGVLRGQESSKEYQAARKHHYGYEPRLIFPKTPNSFAANFRIRFIGGKETSIAPFIEFGHHVCRVRFSQEGVLLLARGEAFKLAEARDFVWETDRWYRMTAEMKDAQFVLQIADGPTLFAEHASFAMPSSSGGKAMGIAGPRHGRVEIDDFSIWSTKSATLPSWLATKEAMPVFEPIQLKEPKKK